jgi:riboflavin kinase/FMN adenylyltransferase
MKKTVDKFFVLKGCFRNVKVWTFTENIDGSFTEPQGFRNVGVTDRAVALGYFDGVHAGHRAILEKLTYEARINHLTAAVHTFSSLPKSKKEDASVENSSVITTIAEKCAYFSLSGADETFLFPFTEHLAEMSPEAFLSEILLDTLHSRVIVCGEDYRFGKDRLGDVSLLRKWAAQNRIDVYTIAPICHDGQVISSSRIRGLIHDGNVHLANILLGYPISYQGTVQVGRKIGRTLGFPTANIAIEEGKVIPAYGVYASLLFTKDEMYPSITSVGVRPTVNPSKSGVLIETTMFDREMDLYGQPIRVYLLEYIRGECCFDGVEMLKDQVFRDMAKVRQYHDRHRYEYSNILPGVV